MNLAHTISIAYTEFLILPSVHDHDVWSVGVTCPPLPAINST